MTDPRLTQATFSERGKCIAFRQRSLLRPWRVERIVQQWTGRCWVVMSRTPIPRWMR